MKFIRVGGLSPKSVKKNHPVNGKLKSFKNIDKESMFGYHSPPQRRGIYAFVSPYFEPFLALWKDEMQKEYEINGIRKFDYEGPVWTHIDISKYGSPFLKQNHTWFLVNTDDFVKVLPKIKHQDLQYLHKLKTQDTFFKDTDFNPSVSNKPYTQRESSISMDHYEVFIPGQFLGRVR